MEKINKTVSFRLDEETVEKIEFIKKHILKNEEASQSELLRSAINFMYENQEQYQLSKGDVINFVHYFVKIAVLQSFVKTPIQEIFGQGRSFMFHLSKSERYELLEDLLTEITRVYEQHSLEEVFEMGTLYDDENPITLAKLVRFKHRDLPELFLGLMGVDKKVFEGLNDDELAEYILERFNEPNFKKTAEERFFIE